MKKHIRVNQSNFQELGVPSELISKLYNLIIRTENGVDVWDAMDNENIENSLCGSFHTGFTYEEYISKILQYFRGTLRITADGYYILFEHEQTKNTLFNIINWTDEGITPEQASNINLTSIKNSELKTLLIKFNEFKYFTNNANLENLFYNCTSLTEITMPNIVVSWPRTYADHSPFNRCSELKKVNWNNCMITGGDKYKKYNGLYYQCTALEWYDGILPPGCDEISNNMFVGTGLTKIIAPEGITYLCSINSMKKLSYIELPSTMGEIDLHDWGRNMQTRIGGTGHIILACKATTPPTILATTGYHDADTTVYVPDELVNTYNNSDWASIPRLQGIYPFSELPQTYKDMGTIE